MLDLEPKERVIVIVRVGLYLVMALALVGGVVLALLSTIASAVTNLFHLS
jgi:hypothetical protein